MNIRKRILKSQKEKRDAAIVRGYESGRSAPELGYEFGINRTSILRIIREVKRRKRR
jgi:hypothetical protein